MSSGDHGRERRARLARARLYLVCPASSDGSWSHGKDLEGLLRAAIGGGVDIVQLREKLLDDDRLLHAARRAQAVCEELGALFIVNDRPDLARQAHADGVHVGQDDMAVADVRELVGPDMLIGLSTHAPGEIDAAPASGGGGGGPAVDYIGVGPVHETPTKPGRPAAGVALVRHAAERAAVPFFAIGGLTSANVDEVLAAGARAVCVLRAVAGAQDPQAAARELRSRVEAGRPG